MKEGLASGPILFENTCAVLLIVSSIALVAS
jgi:hypothetical protein